MFGPSAAGAAPLEDAAFADAFERAPEVLLVLALAQMVSAVWLGALQQRGAVLLARCWRWPVWVPLRARSPRCARRGRPVRRARLQAAAPALAVPHGAGAG